ncbi:MAG: hypothetical protein PHD61_07700 [Bacteroidales bacterium]|nr:hypothetical protein [Lentimicrobiaceae bacterium]MDD5695174.1 hypothetical protein [Bacteroidales bacterium]
MKLKLLATIILLVMFISCNGQQSSPWEKWGWLIGEWKGEGSGQTGQGGGTFSFAYDLDQKILVRKSHSEYPAVENKPLIVHDDLMIVYPDYSGNPSKAIYFDNEGHTIHYTISYAADSIVMNSERIPGVPIFRLTYVYLDDTTAKTVFDISTDGENFKTYIEGKSIRMK